MPYNNFLDNLSEYNAKAAIVISQVVADGNTDKANMMSSLKSTANDITLSETVRLNALTALINLGSLLDIPLPPYFPLTTTYADTQTYVGIHDDLTGIQGGAPGEYYHLTLAERNAIANSATVGDISFANLTGVYTQNPSLDNAFLGKQNALSGTGFVKISGTTISYDNSTYLSTISGIGAGGELTGTYPNPGLSNAAVISKVLTGWNGSVSPAAISSADSILSALQKLNANINNVIANPSGVASVRLTTNSGGVFTTTTSPQTGTATLDVSLNSQSASRFLASPSGAAGVPTFRAFTATDLPNSGATAGTYGSASFIPQIVVDAKGRITSVSSIAAAAGGQVNSVSLSIPAIFGAVTNTGTAADPILTYGLANQNANIVFAGPTTGAAATPSFRSLVEDDIPSLSISKITGLNATLSTFLTDSLSDGTIWVGNVSNGAQQRTLTGDVTLSNTGVTTIGPSKVQYSMIQDVTAQTLLGRYELTNGVVQQINLNATDFVLDNITGELSLAVPVAPVVTTKGDLLSFNTVQDRLPSSNVDGDILMVYNTASNGFGLQWNSINGDVSVTDASTGEMTIANSAVTLAKMANLTQVSFLGSNAAGPYPVAELTPTVATSMLNLFSTGTGTKGLVPGSSGNTSYFLRGDGSWQPISGGGSVTSVSVISANGFAGTVANASTTPAITLSTTITGIVKGNGTAISAASSGTDYVAPGAITSSGLTMATSRLLGRTTALTGAIEEVSVGTSLTLSSTTLSLNVGNANTWTALQTFTSGSGIYIGEAGTSSGNLRFRGTTSGYVEFTSPSAPTNQSYILPTATGTTGQFLKLSDATTGQLAWDTAGGGGGMAIGGSITSSTVGSVLFVGTAGVLAQENGDFFWDNTNKFLGIGTATPECGLHVVTSGSSNIKGVMNMHFDSTAANQAKFIGAKARGSKNSPSALQTDDAITSLSGRGYKASAWSNTVGGFYIYASENWTNSATGTYLTFRGVVAGGTSVTEWGKLSNDGTTTTFNVGATTTLALTTAATTASIFNTTVTTLNIGGAATTVNLGGGSACAINLGGGASVAELRFLEASGNGTNYAAIKSPAALGGNYTLTLPVDDGTSGYALISDGNGVLSWAVNGASVLNKLVQKITQATITNTGTTYTLLDSVLIPANTYTTGDVIMMNVIINKTSTAGGLRIYIHTSAAAGGVTLESGVSVGTGTTGYNWGGILIFYATTETIINRNLATAVSPRISNSNIDWTINQYIVLEGFTGTGAGLTMTSNLISTSLL